MSRTFRRQNPLLALSHGLPFVASLARCARTLSAAASASDAGSAGYTRRTISSTFGTRLQRLQDLRFALRPVAKILVDDRRRIVDDRPVPRQQPRGCKLANALQRREVLRRDRRPGWPESRWFRRSREIAAVEIAGRDRRSSSDPASDPGVWRTRQPSVAGGIMLVPERISRAAEPPIEPPAIAPRAPARPST